MSLHALGRALQRLPAITVVGALGAVLVVGWADRMTGDRLSFSLFYLLPVALVAWVASTRLAVLVSVSSAVTSLAGDVWGHRLEDFVPVWNSVVRLGVMLVVCFTLARLKASLEVQRDLANTDPLTGVLNPRAFDGVAERELARSLRYGRPLALAYLDLDAFKEVNDTLGHSIGDRLLQTVATELASHVRPSDAVARMGGDEFAVLMPEISLDDAVIAFERIRGQLLERMLANGWPVTFSVGFATPRGAGATVDTLIADADRQMYENKRQMYDRKRARTTSRESPLRAPTA